MPHRQCLIIIVIQKVCFVTKLKMINNPSRRCFIEIFIDKQVPLLIALNSTLSEKKCYNDVDPPHTVSFWRFLDRIVVES